MKFTRFLLLPVLLLLAAGNAGAAVYSVSDNVVTAIPDGSSSGVARSLNIAAPGELVVSVEVSLNLGATGGGTAFLGDLYIYLTNGSEIAVLANRPGRTATAPSGYGDNQTMVVTFSPAAAADFHNYRVPVTGSNSVPLSGSLTGSWQADGRMTDPLAVLDTDARTAGLGVFTGDAATGTWSLFAADTSTGATHQINSWGLTVTTIVPEPGVPALGLLTLLGILRRRRSC